MKKIAVLSILICIVFFSSIGQAKANPIRVSDLGAVRLIEEANHALNGKGINNHIELIDYHPSVGEYTIYISELGEKDIGGSVFMLYVNQNGYVEKITLNNNPHDTQSLRYTIQGIMAFLQAVGLTDNEIHELTSQDKISDIHSIWSSKKNRRIILSLNFIQGGTYFKISADDN